MTTKICDLMAIKWRLSAVMADREIDNQALHLLTGLHPGTISKLRNNPPSRIDVITLNLLCTALDCQPGELLRFIPDDPQEFIPDDPQENVSAQKPNKLVKFQANNTKDSNPDDDKHSAA